MIDSTNNKTEPTIMNTNTNPFAAARQNTLTTSAKVLDFDAQSPGVSKPTLSKLLLTREKRGQSDSVLLKPGYRNPGFDYDDDDDGLPLTFKDQVDDKSLSTYASTPKQKLWESPGPNDGLSVITESVGTMTSLDLEGDYPRGKVFFLSPIPPLKKNSKSDFSSETKISLFDAKKCDAKQAQDNSRDTVDSEVNVQTKADLLLPICLNLMCPDLNTISPQTLVDLMNNPKNLHYLIIDCRYGYEYKGGHIKNAVNIQSPEIVEKLFITHKNLVYNPSTLEEIKRDFDGVISKPENYEPTDETSSPPILIFHCEFSQQRGPRAYRALRKFDRTRNDYPKLHYPHVYILDGGYHKFHSEFPTYCDPEGGYLPMKHKNHVKDYSTAREEEVRVWKHRLSIDSLTSVESVRKSSLA